MGSQVEFVTPEGRVSFPHLFEPQGMQGGKPKYSIVLLLPKDGKGVKEFVQKVNARIKELLVENYPDPKKRPSKLEVSIKDGDALELDSGGLKKDKYPEYGNCWVITAKSGEGYPPGVKDISGRQITDAKDIKAGYWARISFNMFFYNNVKIGVSCSLCNVLKVREDSIFGASSSDADDDFAEYFDESAADEFSNAPAEVSKVADDGMDFLS